MLFALPENSHLHVIHFKHPKETEAWLNSLENDEVMDSHEVTKSRSHKEKT